MSEHTAVITWERGEDKFSDNRYHRAHRWEFDGGAVVPGAASPHNVSRRFTDATAVDPEEAFVAALSSCHMLWFLNIAARHGYVVDSYRDEAVGVMKKNSLGKIAITEVTLRPHTVFASAISPDIVNAMHEEAHAECFIANSVKTTLTTKATFEISTTVVATPAASPS